ncbi:MAG: response regulator [Alphaproteobacteria bacterium]|nr:response regulator [Alphaproteobacteria bacterium]
MLQKRGHVVVVAKNGLEAVKAVENDEFDVVLMDMQMPEMDGEEATRVIRRMPPPRGGVPIIALTADVMVEDRERYLKCGINAHSSPHFLPSGRPKTMAAITGETITQEPS